MQPTPIQFGHMFGKALTLRAAGRRVFKVRLQSNVGGGNQLGTGLAAGDSTYRCNESAQDDDRGLISESEDGWFADKDPKAANVA